MCLKVTSGDRQRMTSVCWQEVETRKARLSDAQSQVKQTEVETNARPQRPTTPDELRCSHRLLVYGWCLLYVQDSYCSLLFLSLFTLFIIFTLKQFFSLPPLLLLTPLYPIPAPSTPI